MSAAPEQVASEVRAIPADGLPALLALYEHLHPSEQHDPHSAVAAQMWNEILASPRYRYLGAYVGDVLVSACALTLVPNLTRGCMPYGLIENVVTHAAYRNRGFGKAVLRSALSFAWTQGCYKVMLLTGRKDEPTFGFYESVGFDRHDKQAFVAKPVASG